MLTEREREALERMGERMTLLSSSGWNWRDYLWAEGAQDMPPLFHIEVSPPGHRRSNWWTVVCGSRQGFAERRITVSRSDLRFVPNLCPECRKALEVQQCNRLTP